jgi:TRAP-type C4-dicarboxylate transport system substrate-binding protein
VQQRGRFWLALIALILWIPGAAAREVWIAVAAQDDRHIASVSARHLAELTTPGLAFTLHGEALDKAGASHHPHLQVLPLHDLARDVPELSVVQLPFFYADLAAVQRALDGALGERLKAAATARGWQILAFWDEGMEVMSGNLAYTHTRALQGKEFLVLRDDPMAEIELRALDVWSRQARPDSLSQLHKDCLVDSRSATLQQILAEQLPRVHLDLTLTRHRYEGWVVAMRNVDWVSLGEDERSTLAEKLNGMRAWQRDQAAEVEAAALRELVKAGMTAHPLAPETWQSYRAMQPAWERFLPESLTPNSRLDLVVLAATAAGVDIAGGRGKALPQPLRQAH